MRIHTHTVDHPELSAAAKFAAEESGAPVGFIHRYRHKSRSHVRAFEVALLSDGSLNRHRSQADRDEYAATYDQWGWFLSYLFAVDPDAKAGPYKGEADFHRKTDYRFEQSHRNPRLAGA